MIGIEIEEVVAQAAPELRVMAIEAEVTNVLTPDELWEELSETACGIKETYEISQINKRPAIAATRAAYKALGKDPNRYRPAAEALCRRAVKGMELYRIDAIVDIINLISLKSGYSIGGFDADRIEGDSVALGRGECGEPYEGIGRGMLNIEGMPVYRDKIGGIGTPTSDNERTKLSLNTRRLLMIVNDYGDEMPLPEVERLTRRLLEKYCDARNITVTEYKAR